MEELPTDYVSAYRELIKFYNPQSVLPRKIGKPCNDIVIDYDYDGDLIYAAFYEQYGIDLLRVAKSGAIVPLHWHKFLALLHGLHDTKLNEVMQYRSYVPNDKTTYEQQMKNLKQSWKIPTEDDEKGKKAQAHFEELLAKK